MSNIDIYKNTQRNRPLCVLSNVANNSAQNQIQSIGLVQRIGLVINQTALGLRGPI